MTVGLLLPITTIDKIAALKREIKLRQQVYPSRIAKGRMSEHKADYEISVMQAILQDYESGENK